MTKIQEWYKEIDNFRSYDQLRVQWEEQLDRHELACTWGEDRLNDAVLFFLGQSALPAQDKLGVAFTFVSGVDFDLRLAVGLLHQSEFDPEDEVGIEAWSGAPRPDGSGCCLKLESSDPWLLGYLNGRLAEVSGAMGGERAKWREKFWNEFLLMSCRWADIAGINLAISNGANADYADHRALSIACAGTMADSGSAYYAEDLDEADYRNVIKILLKHSEDSGTGASSAMQSAASVDNCEMLNYLHAQGLNTQLGNDAALIAAAGTGSHNSLEWLLIHGANLHVQNEAPLIAAIKSLAMDMVTTLLDAGADLQLVNDIALSAAFTTMPYDLFAEDDHDFVDQRIDMILLLLHRGANIHLENYSVIARDAPYIKELITKLVISDELSVETKNTLKIFAIA